MPKIGKPKSKPHALKILLLKNQEIIINLNNLNLYSKSYFLNHIANIINERAMGKQYEESGWGLDYGTNDAPQTETKKENNSLIDELERLGNMYEKGLLTDEEFKKMKEKIIDGN